MDRLEVWVCLVIFLPLSVGLETSLSLFSSSLLDSEYRRRFGWLLE